MKKESFLDKVARVRKAVVALAGTASMAVSQGLIQGTAAKWTGLAIAFLTALGVYATPNEPAPVDPSEDGK